MIQIGDRVRSFDFPFHSKAVEGETANFIEGVVQDITENRYVITVHKAVRGGKERSVGTTVQAPINGLEGWFGKTDGVIKIS